MKRIVCLGWLFLVAIFSFKTPLHGDVLQVLNRIADRSRESRSDSVLITHCGRPIFEYHSGPCWDLIDTQAITKSIVALGIGILIQERLLESVEVPVHRFYPEWNQGLKQKITIRHLLANTSGIEYDAYSENISDSANIIQLALCAQVDSCPGIKYHYNDKAVNLLSGIIEKVSGMSMSQFLSCRLFEPLGICNVSWLADTCGNEFAMSHLILTAPDLAKIGELIGNKGWHRGRQLLSRNWIELMTSPGQCDFPFYGWLWWVNYCTVGCYWDDTLLSEYCCAGLPQEFIQRLRNLDGRVVYIDGRTTTPSGCNYFSPELICILGGAECAERFFWETRKKNLPLARWNVGIPRSFSARGNNGQQLIILPGKKIVAVRQIQNCNCNEADPFHDFGALVEELAYRIGCGS